MRGNPLRVEYVIGKGWKKMATCMKCDNCIPYPVKEHPFLYPVKEHPFLCLECREP